MEEGLAHRSESTVNDPPPLRPGGRRRPLLLRRRAGRPQLKRDPLGGARNVIDRSAPMSLEMRARCERCGAEVHPGGDAYICTYECTFCASCAATLAHICPNCRGELVRRPRRLSEGGGM